MTIVEESVSTAYAAPGRPGAIANYRPRYGHYIGGEFVDPVKGQYFENISPVNGKPSPRSPAARPRTSIVRSRSPGRRSSRGSAPRPPSAR